MPTPSTSSKKQQSAEVRRFGRPPLSPSGSVTKNIRLSPEQFEKLEQLGGVAWIRTKIDSAKVKV